MSVDASADKNKKSYEKVLRIHNAIKHNVIDVDIEHLLQTEGDINYRTSEGEPNLLHDSSNQLYSTNLLKLLLDYGADFTLKDKQGRTAVSKIIQNQVSYPYFGLLFTRTFQDVRIDLILAAHIKFNNPSNPCDENGISHFHAACMTNNAEVVDFFLKNGVDVNQAVDANSPIFPSYTALEFAVRYTSPHVVELLLKYDANMHTKNYDGLGPLQSIIERKVSKCEITEKLQFVKTMSILIKFVIDNSIDNVDDNDDFGLCKLHVACLLGDELLVENILNQATNINQDVNMNSPICGGYTALHFAAFSNVKIFKLLLQNGANIEAHNAKGQTPFDLCLENYTARDIHSIISLKKEWGNITLSDNETKLLAVIFAMENLDEFQSFLNSHRHLKVLNRYIPHESPLWPGYTLLHLAVIFAKKVSDLDITFFKQKEDTNFIEELLKRGAEISTTDPKGLTALHLAFYMQKHSIVRCLLIHQTSSNLNPIDKNNLSHFHIACASGQQQAVKLFLSNHVNVNAPVLSTFGWYTNATKSLFADSKRGTRHFSICPGYTALHIAVVCGNYEIIEMLLKHGADVYAQDANGFTPIHRLLSCRDQEAVFAKSLLKVKHLRNITTNCGLSHLHVACYFGNYEAVEKLLKTGANVKVPVTYTFDSRVKDYDEFFCDSCGDYTESRPFLADYADYTPLEFFWHPHSINEDCDSKTFWKISFMLIKRNPDVFANDDKGISLLKNLLREIISHESDCLYAMLCESIPILARLEEEFGVTKLHLACCLSDAKAVENTLKYGANVNAKVNSNSPVWQGFTPLHFVLKRAAENDQSQEIWDAVIKNIRILMKHGADPLLVDFNNDTPFHVIKRFQRYGISESIQFWSFITSMFNCMKSYNVNPVDDEGLSVFHIACAVQNKVAVERFLKIGVNINQAIDDFLNFSPGSTPLHLLITYYHILSCSSSTGVTNDENFLQILVILLENGADINAKDAFGETPLFQTITLRRSRQILIEILISHGADVHATMMPKNNTPFELLLRQGDATQEEIDLFLKAGCQWNAYNPTTQEGYMAEVFCFLCRKTVATNNIMDNQIFTKILNDPKINQINELGRTAIHNVVSINYIEKDGYDFSRTDRHKGRKFRFWSSPKSKYKTRVLRLYSSMTTKYKELYSDLIEQLCIRGCDVDHEDNEGKTALHLAVAFKNIRAIVPLLKMGADIEIADKNGKTALDYCFKTSSSYDELCDLKKVFAEHVYKLEFCEQFVNRQNKQMRYKTLNSLGPMADKYLNGFLEEMETTKNMNIGATSLSLYEFLTNTDVDFIYMNMTNEERLEVDQFFQNIRQHKFVEIDGLLRLKYRQSIERKKLVEPALESLNLLSEFEIPDLCGRYILKFLKNEDLKRLIASVE